MVLLGWDNSLKEPRTSDAFKLSFVIVQSPIYRVFFLQYGCMAADIFDILFSGCHEGH